MYNPIRFPIISCPIMFNSLFYKDMVLRAMLSRNIRWIWKMKATLMLFFKNKKEQQHANKEITSRTVELVSSISLQSRCNNGVSCCATFHVFLHSCSQIVQNLTLLHYGYFLSSFMWKMNHSKITPIIMWVHVLKKVCLLKGSFFKSKSEDPWICEYRS